MGNEASSVEGPALSIVLLGEARSGKSTFLNYIATGSAPLDPNTYYQTVAPTVESVRWKLQDGTDVDVQIWDTSGDQGFTHLAFPYLRYADAFIFMYDLTSSSSFESLRGWWNMIQKLLGKGTKPCYALIGTHSDCHDQRVVSHKRASSFVLGCGMPHTNFFEVCCTTGDKIDVAMEAIAREALAIRRRGETVLDQSLAAKPSTRFQTALAAFADVEAQEQGRNAVSKFDALDAAAESEDGDGASDPDGGGDEDAGADGKDGSGGTLANPSDAAQGNGFLASLMSCGGQR